MPKSIVSKPPVKRKEPSAPSSEPDEDALGAQEGDESDDEGSSLKAAFLAQALRSGTDAEVARLVLTASGGPFRGRRRDQLESVTPAEALAHPTWDMAWC